MLYDSLAKWFLAGVWKQDDGVVLFRNSGDSATDLRQFKMPAPGRYRFRIAASAHQLGNPSADGGAARQLRRQRQQPRGMLGYFDAPPAAGGHRVRGAALGAQRDDQGHARRAAVRLFEAGERCRTIRAGAEDSLDRNGRPASRIVADRELPPRVRRCATRRTARWPTRRGCCASCCPGPSAVPWRKANWSRLSRSSRSRWRRDSRLRPPLRAGIKAVLASPEFLYLREPAGALDDYALASRLSYFLWSTMPDETALRAGRSGELRKPGRAARAGRADAAAPEGAGVHRELHRPVAESARHRRHHAGQDALSRSSTSCCSGRWCARRSCSSRNC